ncbi:MAG TPA: hypothetical protein VN457_03725, partial [Chlamydiales bacterium]|nr:hypothetical protein [Chlamydiales bacterium]
CKIYIIIFPRDDFLVFSKLIGRLLKNCSIGFRGSCKNPEGSLAAYEAGPHNSILNDPLIDKPHTWDRCNKK